MSPLVLRRLVVASLFCLGTGCASRPKDVSQFVRTYNVSETFAAVAKQTGVTQRGSGITNTTDSLHGTAHCSANARYCARPDQIDEVMRVVHAEFMKQLRENGAEPSGDAPPTAPAPVKEWKISYTAGTQAGTITVTRNDGADGPCAEKDRREFKLEFLLDEAPKTSR